MEPNGRLVPIVGDLVRCLHRVVEEHQVTEPELRQALGFLAEVGAADEWVLLSDVLGISVAVDDNTYRQEGAWRPAHFHVKCSADGFRPLTTMVYLQGDPWLHDDTISSVKPGLVTELARHDRPEELRDRGLERPFYTGAFDFVLKPG